MRPSETRVDTTVLAEPIGLFRDRISLMHGWVPLTISRFKHRGELVYLPPVYFSSNPPPALPTVMMIGGQFNTPADWIRTANAVHTIDEFAARHGDNAPVFDRR